MTQNQMTQSIAHALMSGCHTTETIIANKNLYGEYSLFCKTLASMQGEGLVVHHNDNMAQEYGYFLTEEGQKQLIK